MAAVPKPISDTVLQPGKVRRWLRLREGEGRPVLWLGMLALILGIFSAAYLIGGTATLVVAVEANTFRWLLPLLYLAAGLAAFAARWWFSALEQMLAPKRFALITLGLAFSLVLLLGGALARCEDEPRLWIASVWFVSIAPILAVMDLLFWAVVRWLFNTAQVQRLSRAVTGLTVSTGMLSFLCVVELMLVAYDVLHWKGIKSAIMLLGVAGAGLLFACFPIRALIAVHLKLRAEPAPRGVGNEPIPAARPLRDAYVLLLAGLALTLVLAHYLIDFAFLTSFIGGVRGEELQLVAVVLAILFFLVKVAELLFRAFPAKWLSRRLGPGYGLQVLPLALIAGVAFALWVWQMGSREDRLFIAALLKGLETLLRGPAFEPSFSVAFQPLPGGMEASARRLIAKRVRPLAVVIASAILLVLSALGPQTWLWTLGFAIVAMLGLSLLARRVYRLRIVGALGPNPGGTMTAAESEEQFQPPTEADATIALKALPLFIVEFPGEYKGASAERRSQAFERLLGLPDNAALRPIRAAAARRSVRELKQLAASSLLAEAQAASIGPNAPLHFGSTVVPSGEDFGYGPASLALLRGLDLVLPEPAGPEQELQVSAAPEPVETPQAVAVQIHDRNNPYPGLRPFEPEEARLFFGRSVHTRELLQRLSRTRFLAVVGTSGSGKSSLVRAGLIPALREGAFGTAVSHWRIAILRPGGDPIGALALALVGPEVLGETSGATSLDRDLQATLAEVTLRRSAIGLTDVVRHARLGSGEHVLVVVDQFEELFRFKREAEDRRGSEDAAAFVKLLLEASRAQDLPVYVVLTMRSDYLGNCAEFQDLPETINDAQYLIPRLTRDQRRETIVSPVRVAGGAITPRLVQRLLNDVSDSPDQLPIMQHALMRTWDRWAAAAAPNDPLDTPHYEEVGRMESALSQHADEIYYALGSDRLRKIAELIFKALTKAEDGRGVRRATRLDKLAAAVEAQPKEVEAVIEAFRRPGCSFLMPPAGTPLPADTMVDISHESLMRIWERLRKWVDEEAESAQTYRRLAETADLQLGLWRDPDLTQALDWRERERPNETWAQRYHPKFTAAMTFLDTSDQVSRQARRRTQTLTLGGLGFAIVIAVAMSLLWARAQTNLNKVQAFADAEELDRLTIQCPLLFAPETVRPDMLREDLVGPCDKALQALKELSERRHKYEETLKGLREEGVSGGILFTTLSRLVVKLETLEGTPFLPPGANRVEVLEKLVGELQRAYNDAKWPEAVAAI